MLGEMDISTVLFALMFPKYADMQNLIKLYTLCEVYYISVIHLGGTSGKEPTCQCRKLRDMADMQNLIKLYTLCEVYYILVIHLGGTSGKEPTCQCRKLRDMAPSLRLG